MGLKILPQKSGEILLELIMRRYENRSTMMTSNRPIEEWGKLLSDVPVREFYSAEDLGFLDRICGIIERLEDVHQRTLARSALVRTCMKKQPRGKFTVAAIPRLALHHLFS